MEIENINFSIGTIAKLYGIPTSTLRYWEEQNLFLSRRNLTNDYRQYDLQTTIELLDVIFYRNLNVPIKKVKELKLAPPETVYDILAETETQVEAKIKLLEQKIKGIKNRKAQLAQLFALQAQPYKIEKLPLKKVGSLNLYNPKDIEVQLAGPSTFILLKESPAQKVFTMGLDLSEAQHNDSHIIWQNQKSSEKTYFTCLLETSLNDFDENNLDVHLNEMNNRGYRVTEIIAQYLITNGYGSTQPVEYYKAWLAVEPI